MAIRTISYSVKSDGISPNTEQQAGLQSEHAVTELVFTLDSTLYQALLSEKSETDTLVYRFDCCDSMGGAVKTEPSALTGSTVTFTVGENLTRSGGKARVYLVISRYNAEEKTETELLSFPAKLRFENVPETDSDNGVSRESLSTLTEAAKNAAERAKQSADTAVEAQGKTETARLAIEGGSTVIFDGNGTYGKTDVDLVVDTELSKASDNAISNKAVTMKFDELTNLIDQIKKQVKEEAILSAHPLRSLYWSDDPTDPAALFGGTWERVKDVFLLAAGDTYSAGDTGGEAEHTLTVEEMPSHNQKIAVADTASGNISAPNTIRYSNSSTAYLGELETKSAGNGQPHNNMPPYLANYCWRRIA